jgi:flagellar assembly protein FliH
MSLHHVERFGFDRIFATQHGEAPTGASLDDLTLELASLRAELALLKSDQATQIAIARAEGFDAGLAQARSERDTALLSAVDALQAGIETLDERFGEVSDRVTGEAAQIAVAAADMIAGRALALSPEATIDEAIGRVLGTVARGTELEIRVHPELIEALEAKIAERQSKDRRKLNLTVVGDVTLARGDAMIGWEQGGLALSADARREAVMTELETLLPRD